MLSTAEPYRRFTRVLSIRGGTVPALLALMSRFTAARYDSEAAAADAHFSPYSSYNATPVITDAYLSLSHHAKYYGPIHAHRCALVILVSRLSSRLHFPVHSQLDIATREAGRAGTTEEGEYGGAQWIFLGWVRVRRWDERGRTCTVRPLSPPPTLASTCTIRETWLQRAQALTPYALGTRVAGARIAAKGIVGWVRQIKGDAYTRSSFQNAGAFFDLVASMSLAAHSQLAALPL
ncbi:hypothetical protein B0H14DRAFT_2645892 [Mycena olivaceomarginata]|nr:hypothetical protein B0H14DRAFT_2645892 [Mycena olivaceomarginata]